ncbi:MAG: DUF1501 domain-containing protein [Spirosomataceae bacterium]
MAELITSGYECLLCLSSGFDTHSSKRPARPPLRQYAEAVATFTEDLKANNSLDDVMIMTFSEFGRRSQTKRLQWYRPWARPTTCF